MKILWSVHLYVPHHCAGAEQMSHQINKFLITKGHEVRVINNNTTKYNIHTPYTFEGVDVHRRTGDMDQYRWADVILTHLEYTHNTAMLAHILHRPVVHVVHNDTPYTSVINAGSRMHVVYNSQWIADKLKYKWPSVVLHPPVDHRYYGLGQHPQADYITLINANENKGGHIVRKIAAAMPNRKFLIVTGSYEDQHVLNMPPNVTIWPNQVDIRPAYNLSRLLLVPSKYESWGRVATEAMCNGVPVICTLTPGLRENCAEAGTYISDREDIGRWVQAIESFDNPAKYEKMANLALQRAKELDPISELNRFEDFLLAAHRNNKR